MPFTFEPIAGIPELVLVRPKMFHDERGLFLETFKASEFARAGLPAQFVQGNESRSRRGVVRGLHYQLPPHAQGKLVRCPRGAILDVAVDVRRMSATFGRHHAVRLDSESRTQLWIPPGFAHGFQALEDGTDVEYLVAGGEYRPDSERSLRWNDPQLGIAWPIPNALLAVKDAAAPTLDRADLPE